MTQVLVIKEHSYKNFLKKILPLALPILIQNFVSSSFGMLDGIMISHYGDHVQAMINMAAVSQANRVFFVVMLCYFGISAGASIFFSQFFGNQNYDGLRRILGVALSLGLIISLFPFFGSLFYSHELMSFFVSHNDQQVINLGASFMKIMAWSYPVYIASWIYGYALRSIGHPYVVMMSSISALFLNSILNFFLIYGFLKIPAFGIQGAACATVIARFFEFFFLIIFIYGQKSSPLKLKIVEIFQFRWEDFRRYLRTSLPVILEEVLWGAGITVSFAIYGFMGRTTLTASAIAGPFIDLSFVVFFALAQAASITMGKMIGQKKSQEELHYTARQYLILAFYASLIVIACLNIFPAILIPRLYPVAPEAIHLAISSLYALEVLFLVRGVEMVGSIGILRGSGDTLYCIATSLTCMWLIMVPLVYVTGIVLHWSLPYVLLSSFLYDFSLFVFVLLRIRTNHWIKDITYNTDPVVTS